MVEPVDVSNFGKRNIAEFGMWQFDYPRYDKLLTSADEMFIATQNKNTAYIEPFFNILKSLYYNWRPLIYDTKRVWFVDKFEEIKHLIDHWKSTPALNKRVPISIISKEEELYSKLLEQKQLIGLGIKTIRKESTRTKIRRAFGTGGD